MKKFLIIMLSICACFLIAAGAVVVFLAESDDKVNFSLSGASRIVIYNKNLNGTEIKNTDEKYDKIVSAFEKGLKESKLSQINNGKKLNTNPRVCSQEKEYASLIKDENLCIEFEYEEAQTIVLFDGNDTKQITYVHILILMDADKGMTDHVIYYGTTQNAYDGAFVISLNDTKLQKILL